MHDVAELLLRMVGDADGGDVAVQHAPIHGPWCNACSCGHGAFLSADVTVGDEGQRHDGAGSVLPRTMRFSSVPSAARSLRT